MKQKLTLFILGAILIITALFFIVRQVTYHEQKLTPTPSPKNISFVRQDHKIDLKPLNNSGVSGKAELKDINYGKFKVSVEINNLATSAATPIFIHSGNCSSIGKIKYALVRVRKGISNTILTGWLHELDAQKPLSIVLHKSQKELNKYIACGDIP